MITYSKLRCCFWSRILFPHLTLNYPYKLFSTTCFSVQFWMLSPFRNWGKYSEVFASLIIFLGQDIYAYFNVNVRCCTHNFWGSIWGMYNWNPFEDVQRHSDRCPIDAKVGMSHVKRILWAAVPHPQHLSTWHEPYTIWGFFSKVQRCGNCMAISLGSIQDVWASPITWYSVGLQLDGRVHAAEWCCQ